MDNSLISVIVPVYNVERYLPRCIESILGQTYTNFELILVDDGTPDRSGIICDKYSEKDSRIKVIHKENGGVSSARNAGIDIAEGEWITFVDSDDWVTDDYLDVLVDPLRTGNYDLTVGVLEWRSFHISSNPYEAKIINTQNLIKSEIDILDCNELSGACLKLFSAEIIEENNIRFPDGIKIAEDAIFVAKYLKECKHIFLTGKVIYHYNFINDSSVSKTNRYYEEINLWFSEYINAYAETLRYWGVSDDIFKYAISKKTVKMFSLNIKNIIRAFDEETSKTKINAVFSSYEKWIANLPKKNVDGLEKYFVDKNVNAIYEELKPRKSHKRLCAKFKTIIKQLSVPFIEKHRDGLRKIKVTKNFIALLLSVIVYFPLWL